VRIWRSGIVFGREEGSRAAVTALCPDFCHRASR
jgi:hypothetical protein